MDVRRVLIVGMGAIARRHLKNLKALAPSVQVCVWRRSATRDDLGELDLLVDQVVTAEADAIAWGAEAALITGPASSHIEVGLALAAHGIHLFVEKPLSHSLDGVDDLIERCRSRRLVLMVGYNFRFYPPLSICREALNAGRIGKAVSFRAEVGQYLPDWRPGLDYRQSVSACRILGGGALLELSHELDTARHLMGEVRTVSAQTDHLSDLEMDVEDVAEITLRFTSGAMGSIHLDMIQRTPTRWCRVIGTEGTLEWQWHDHRVRLFSTAAGKWLDLSPPGTIDRDEMYLSELRHFLDCVRDGREPSVTGEDGKNTLRIALGARASSLQGRVVEL